MLAELLSNIITFSWTISTQAQCQWRRVLFSSVYEGRKTSDTVCFLMSGDLAKNGIILLVRALLK